MWVMTTQCSSRFTAPHPFRKRQGQSDSNAPSHRRGTSLAGKRKTRLTGAGDAIESAVREVIANGAPLTYDLVGLEEAADGEVTTAIIEIIAKKPRSRVSPPLGTPGSAADFIRR